MKEKVKVVYIVGDGRSGSTLLESILNSSDNVVSVGECYRFWERYFKGNTLCGCGTLISECPLWGQVAKNLAKMSSLPVNEIRDIIRRLLLFKNFDKIPKLRLDERYNEFFMLVEQFYLVISHVSGKNVIIDSSKSPSWGYILSQLDSLDIHFIHLERNLADVAESWLKENVKLPEYVGKQVFMPQKTIQSSIRTWVRVHILSRRLRKGKYLHIKFEDLCQDMPTQLGKIQAFINAPYFPFDNLRYKSNHGIAGNPIRLAKLGEEIRVDTTAGKRYRKTSPLQRKLLNSIYWVITRTF